MQGNTRIGAPLVLSPRLHYLKTADQIWWLTILRSPCCSISSQSAGRETLCLSESEASLSLSHTISLTLLVLDASGSFALSHLRPLSETRKKVTILLGCSLSDPLMHQWSRRWGLLQMFLPGMYDAGFWCCFSLLPYKTYWLIFFTWTNSPLKFIPIGWLIP